MFVHTEAFTHLHSCSSAATILHACMQISADDTWMHILSFILWTLSRHMESMCASGNHKEPVTSYLWAWKSEEAWLLESLFTSTAATKLDRRPFLSLLLRLFFHKFTTFYKSICWIFAFTSCSCGMLGYLQIVNAACFFFFFFPVKCRNQLLGWKIKVVVWIN